MTQHGPAVGAVLVSGGMDSVLCLYMAKARYRETIAVHCQYGQPNGDAELAATTAVCSRLEVPMVLVQLGTAVAGVPTSAPASGANKGISLANMPARNLVLLGAATSAVGARWGDPVAHHYGQAARVTIFVGDTRSKKLLRRLKAAEVGQIIIRGRLRKRALDIWAYDNGAYEDFKAGREFDGDTFLSDLRIIRDSDGPKPDFIVLPDRVGAGIASLVMSIEWHRKLKAEKLDSIAPLYFAVQDGMCVVDVPFETVDGIFLGGSLPWKLANAADYAFAAQARKRPFHYARCGTRRRVMHAMALRADSLDSCLPLWSKDKCRVFLDALAQEMLFHETPQETPKPPKCPPLGPGKDHLRP